jgi:hypothetical protein
MEAVHSIGLLSGFCYTQFADTYQEANGLLFANRQPKCDIGRLRDATRGRRIPAPQGAAEDLQMQPAANAEGPEHVQALDEEA